MCELIQMRKLQTSHITRKKQVWITKTNLHVALKSEKAFRNP